MWGSGYMGTGAMGFGMILLWLIPVGLLIWCVLRSAGSRGNRENDAAGAPRAAREILDARYAAGDIGRKEYLQRRADLEGANGP